MPALGLGTWKSAKGEVYTAVRKAIEIGYKHFDCAFIYGNEHEIGDAIADAIKNNEVKREDLWITSKLWNNRHRKQDTQPAIEITLKDLKLDYLDLYLIHWPVAHKYDVSYPQNGSELVSLNEIPVSETQSKVVLLKKRQLLDDEFRLVIQNLNNKNEIHMLFLICVANLSLNKHLYRSRHTVF